MSRRNGRRLDRRNHNTRPAGGASADRLYGVNALTDSDYYVTASPGGEPGTAAGFVCGVAFTLGALDNTQARYLYGRFNGTQGWLLYLQASVNQATFYVINGTATPSAVALPAFTAGDIGKVHYLTGVHTGAGNTATAYLNDVVVAVTSPTVGFTPAAVATYLGRGLSTGSASRNITLHGAWSGTGVPSQANVQAFSASLKATKRVPVAHPGATMTHSYCVGRSYAGSLPATLVDSPGTDNATLAGTPVLVSTNTPTWAW